MSPILLVFFMIDIDYLRHIVEKEIAEKDIFLVNIDVSPSNSITVKIDSKNGISIKECIQLNRFIENNFDRDEEDYQLEVSSPGIDQPFQVIEQYEKYVGKEIEIVLINGDKFNGILKSTNENEIELEIEKKISIVGKKKKEKVKEQRIINYKDMKSAKLKVMFK